MKRGIVLAAYGAVNQEGKQELARFEGQCRERFANIPVRWAFTSSLQRERLVLQRRKSDSLAKALTRLSYEQFDQVAIQPLQIVPGSEYGEVVETVGHVSANTGLVCQVGKPLLADEAQIPAFAELLANYACSAMDSEGCGVFMAHGAKHPAGRLVTILANALEATGKQVFLGAMSSAPALHDIIPKLRQRKTWLFPFLSVAGMHALRDMAGCSENSWKVVIEKSGSECVPILRGLIETPVFAQLWLNNLDDALANA